MNNKFYIRSKILLLIGLFLSLPYMIDASNAMNGNSLQVASGDNGGSGIGPAPLIKAAVRHRMKKREAQQAQNKADGSKDVNTAGNKNASQPVAYNQMKTGEQSQNPKPSDKTDSSSAISKNQPESNPEPSSVGQEQKTQAAPEAVIKQ